MMRHTVRSFVALILFAAGFVAVSSGGTAAPPELQPVTLPCATGMFIQRLGQATPAAAADQALVLVRATFEPGGGIGPHTHPGTLVLAIESGTFGFTPMEEGEMVVMRSGEAGTPAVEEPITQGQEVELKPGDWLVEMGMVHSARTIGDEPVVVTFTGLITAGEPLTTCVEES
jgi:quercetin dioxygenase-like cupin family protein